MLPRIVKRAESQPEPDCNQCPDGAGVAITIYIPGVGDGVNDDGTIEYVAPHAEFVRDYASGIRTWHSIEGYQVTDPPKRVCCHKVFCEAQLDPCKTARDNADALRVELVDLLGRFAPKPWVRVIHLHVLGFSAGGIIAVNMISGLPCSIARSNTAPLCKEDMEGPIPLVVDLVTMATPFGRPAAILEVPVIRHFWDFFTRYVLAPLPIAIGRVGCRAGIRNRWPLINSLFGNDYQDPVPKRPDGTSCLCHYVAYVSSSEHGDTSSGADRNPGEDPRLEGWDPEVVLLAERWADLTDADGEEREVTHPQVPLELYGEQTGVLDPGCVCTETY